MWKLKLFNDFCKNFKRNYCKGTTSPQQSIYHGITIPQTPKGSLLVKVRFMLGLALFMGIVFPWILSHHPAKYLQRIANNFVKRRNSKILFGASSGTQINNREKIGHQKKRLHKEVFSTDLHTSRYLQNQHW